MKKCFYSGKATAFSEVVWSMERKRACGPNSFLWKFGPGRGKMRVDQIIIRGSMVHGEEKCGWTKLFSEGAWSMERKRAGGPKSFQRRHGPWRKEDKWTKPAL